MVEQDQVVGLVIVESHEMGRRAFLPLVVTAGGGWSEVAGDEVYLHIGPGANLCGPALYFCKSPQFEVKVFPAFIEHFPIKLFDPA